MTPALALARSAARHWRLGLELGLVVVIVVLKLSLAGEQRHSAKLQTALGDAVAAHQKFKADVGAQQELARQIDQADANRVERDQVVVSQETLSAYQKEIAALRARAAAIGVRTAGTTSDGNGGSRRTDLPSVSGAAGGNHGAACQDGFSAADRLIASEIAVRLRSCQNWIREQQAVRR